MRALFRFAAITTFPLLITTSVPVFASEPATLTVTSEAFQHEGKLPVKYSCNGDDISPPLNISNIPENAQTLVLIHDDPDAGGWMHWLLYDLPVTGSSLALMENAPKEPVWEDGTMQGRNDWGDANYGGACPPDGQHRYLFTVYALDTQLNLKKKRSVRKVKKAMKKHIIAKGKIMAKYP